jgi:hypothetical protein
MRYFDFIKDYLPRLGETEGCPEDDITRIETEYHLKLPAAYREFLLLFGKKSGLLLRGYCMTVDKVRQNREDVEFDLKNTIHSNTFKIEPDMFFFGQWQGSFLFFRCGKSEDPEVYLVTTLDDIILYKNSFTAFVKEEGLE